MKAISFLVFFFSFWHIFNGLCGEVETRNSCRQTNIDRVSTLFLLSSSFCAIFFHFSALRRLSNCMSKQMDLNSTFKLRYLDSCMSIFFFFPVYFQSISLRSVYYLYFPELLPSASHPNLSFISVVFHFVSCSSRKYSVHAARLTLHSISTLLHCPSFLSFIDSRILLFIISTLTLPFTH